MADGGSWMSWVRPHHPLMCSAGVVAVGWALFLLIDAANLAGMRDRLEALDTPHPAIWFHLFAEGGPVEILQWIALGAACVMAALVSGRVGGVRDARSRAASQFWALMSIALVLMLIEDAGNPRHELRHWAETLSASGAIGRLAELGVLASIAAVPLYAVARYGRVVWSYAGTRMYLLGAFVLYGTAATMSATRYQWYEHAGAAINASVGGDLVRVDEFHQPTEFWLMDYMVEESIELVAASMMLAAVLAFARESPGARGLPSVGVDTRSFS